MIDLSKLPRAAALLGFIIAASTASSRAETIYPFCRLGGGDIGTGVGACNYASFEQCRQASAGYGMCTANPAYVAPGTPAMPQRRAKRGGARP